MNILKEKSFQLSVEVVLVADEIKVLREFIFANQILRAGTSVGANVEEALEAQSTKDFIAKLSIAYKEARELGYWFRLLVAMKKIDHVKLKSADIILTEVTKLLISIIKKSKENLTINS